MTLRKEFYFNLTNHCMNDCIFCIAEKRKKMKEIDAKKFLEICRSEHIQNNEITLCGGEPTILSDFIEILRIANATNSNIVLLSNGRKFSEEAYCIDVLACNNISEIHIPIHGPEHIHDFMTRRNGSFRQTIQGIRNILHHKKGSTRVIPKIVLCKSNYRELINTVKSIHREFPDIDEVAISSLKIPKDIKSNVEDIAFNLSDIEAIMNDLIDYCETSGITLILDHLPACIIGEKNYLRYMELKRKPAIEYSDFEQIYFDGITAENLEERIVLRNNIEGHVLKTCVICRYYDGCQGIEKSYAEFVTDRNLNPLRYVDERLMTGLDGNG